MSTWTSRCISCCFIIIVGFADGRPCFAQPAGQGSSVNYQITVDVLGELNRKLADGRTYRKQRVINHWVQDCELRCCGHACEADCPRCKWVEESRTETYTEHLHMTNLNVEEVSELIVDQQRVKTLPEEVYLDSVRILNCGSSEINESFSLSRTLTVGHSVTKSRALRTGQQINAGLRTEVLSLGITLDTSVTLTDTATETRNSQVTQSRNTTLRAKGGGVWTTAELAVFKLLVELPFSGTVTFDGTVDANLEGVTHLSQLLQKPDRTLQVEGVLRVTAASDSTVRLYERKAADHECAQGAADGSYTVIRAATEGPAGGWSTLLGHPLPSSGSVVLDVMSASPGGPQAGSKLRTKLPTTGNHVRVLEGGTPGLICYIAGCDFPYDGYREICYYTDEGACMDCWREFDPQCEPVDPGPENE